MILKNNNRLGSQLVLKSLKIICMKKTENKKSEKYFVKIIHKIFSTHLRTLREPNVIWLPRKGN